MMKSNWTSSTSSPLDPTECAESGEECRHATILGGFAWWFLFFFIQIHGGFPWWFSRDPITWKRELMGFDHQGIHRVPVKNWDLVIKTRDKSGTDVNHYYSTAITCCTMQCFRRSLPFDNNNMNKSTANKRDYVTRLGMYTSWGCKCTYYMDLNGVTSQLMRSLHTYHVCIL